MNEQSRFFRIREDAPSVLHKNHGTIFRAPFHQRTPFDAREFFIERYPAIRDGMSRHDRLGVLMLAFDQDSRPIAEAWVEASLEKTRAVVLGRHTRCRFRVPASEAAVSLRHLAVLVRATSHQEIRIRALDLQTGLGFSDEMGRALESVTCDGPFFVSIGSIRVVLLVTGEPPIPDAHDAYACIPERVFFDERDKGAPRPEHCDGGTLVRSLAGPVSATSRLVAPDEEPGGLLEITGRGMRVERELGETALRRGLLLGRYSRCDVRTGTDAQSISRVHAMIIREGRELLVIDMASSNGTCVAGRSISCAALEEGEYATLGHSGDLVFRFQHL